MVCLQSLDMVKHISIRIRLVYYNFERYTSSYHIYDKSEHERSII